jgi:glycosyltransferase involved in cell wall biosynthesis
VRVLIAGPLPEHAGGRTTGGVATHVETLATALAGLGHEVGVYADNTHPDATPHTHAWGRSWSRAPLAGAHKTGLITRPGAWAPLARTLANGGPGRLLGKSNGWLLSNALGLKAAAAALRPDVAHYHQPDVRPLYGRLAAVTVPSVITLHSLAAFEPGEPAALGDLAHTNLARANAIIAVSEDVRDGLPADLRTPGVRVIPNGVDLAAFTRPTGAGRAHDQGAPSLLYIGRVTEDKGVGDLLAALAVLRHSHPGARAVIAGPPVDFDVAKAAVGVGLAADAVEATGPVSTQRLAELLHTADALVMPSRLREGQGRVIIEAMAASVPVVATAVGAVPELLEHGAAGLIVPPADPAVLAAALARLLGEADLRERLVARGLQAATRFDATAVAREIVAVYERVAQGTRDATDPSGAL